MTGVGECHIGTLSCQGGAAQCDAVQQGFIPHAALASDLIWHELELVQKPFVVSMGDVAGSGGYYIAMGADKIFSEPNTLTGSIGVFGVIPYFKELAQKNGFTLQDRIDSCR